jgi:signal transduction histidine kinase
VSTPEAGIGVRHVPEDQPGHDRPSRARARDLADEQAALRRLAALTASSAEPAEVFSVVAHELGRLIDAEAAFVTRVEQLSGEDAASAGSVTVVGSYGEASDPVPAGFQVALRPATTAYLLAGGPARISGDRPEAVPFGEIVGHLGMRATVAVPIVVHGRSWGMALAATSQGDFPPGTESRMTRFTELAALAISNAQTEQKLRAMTETQESLRRLAMLVAGGDPPDVLFAAVTKEVQRHFGGGTARMIRFELDGSATLLANEGTSGPPRTRRRTVDALPKGGLAATVWRTGRPARIDDYHHFSGGEPYLGQGLRSAVAVPVIVNGQLWGAIAVGTEEGALPADTEQRILEFTDLVATAVANAQGRAELMASRARIVAASDEARRRIERDLHDGAEQRLVGLGIRLRAAAAASSDEGGEIRSQLVSVAAELLGVIDELREMSRGIHPAILFEAGLRPALRALGRRSAIPVEIDVRADRRLPEPVEAGAYYVVSEMLANAAKHAHASLVQVNVATSGGILRVSVHDDGVGGADPLRGSGLLGLKDRIDALGGTFSLHSPAGQGTTVKCQLQIDGGGSAETDPAD